MDGTLFLGDSVLYLNEKLHLSPKLDQYHGAYYRGEITEVEMNFLQTPILQKLEIDRAFEILNTGPMLKQIQEGVRLLKEKGRLEVSMLTFNPFQGLYTCFFGIGSEVSPSVEIRDNRIARIKTLPQNKIFFLRKYCEGKGISLNQCIHVGEGKNDVPTFKEIGFSVALNAKEERVKRGASVALETDDFYDVARTILERISQ